MLLQYSRPNRFLECCSVVGLKQVLRQENVEYVVAPYEADAQMAFLARNGHVDLVITEDSDLIAYGCPQVEVTITKSLLKASWVVLSSFDCTMDRCSSSTGCGFCNGIVFEQREPKLVYIAI